MEHLAARGALTPHARIADVGSGTGLLTELFLRQGFAVFGVEPNADMRAAGEKYLRAFSTFTSVAGTAEATTLADGSIDLITVGQAFHWFDRPATKKEFRRILKPGGYVALVWNERLVNSPFLVAYEEMLRQVSLDYTAIDHRQMTDALITEFFSPERFELTAFDNVQHFDLEGLTGRLLSSSYAPPPGHPSHEPMLVALREIFNKFVDGERVTFTYHTKIYLGKFA